MSEKEFPRSQAILKELLLLQRPRIRDFRSVEAIAYLPAVIGEIPPGEERVFFSSFRLSKTFQYNDELYGIILVANPEYQADYFALREGLPTMFRKLDRDLELAGLELVKIAYNKRPVIPGKSPNQAVSMWHIDNEGIFYEVSNLPIECYRGRVTYTSDGGVVVTENLPANIVPAPPFGLIRLGSATVCRTPDVRENGIRDLMRFETRPKQPHRRT